MQLKRIHANGIPKAIEKAQQYRVLNEPWLAESICRDVLAVDDKNQDALATLILALTDQFERGTKSHDEAQELLPQLASEYERDYYDGIIHERWAKARFLKGSPSHVAKAGLTDAMACYEKAEAKAPRDNDDALLRYNTCVRLLEHLDDLRPHARPTVHFEDADGPPAL